MRLVFDPNVIVAGLVSEGLCHEVIETHLPDHTAIISRMLWDELLEKLRDKFGLTAKDLPLLDLYHRHATWVEPPPLVTGDGDLLVLGAYEGVAILSPRQFVERLVRGR